MTLTECEDPMVEAINPTGMIRTNLINRLESEILIRDYPDIVKKIRDEATKIVDKTLDNEEARTLNYVLISQGLRQIKFDHYLDALKWIKIMKSLPPELKGMRISGIRQYPWEDGSGRDPVTIITLEDEDGGSHWLKVEID